MRKNKQELNAKNLKQILWETLEGVRAKRVDVSAANAVSQLSREIMSVVNTEIKISQLTGAALPGFGSPQIAVTRKQK